MGPSPTAAVSARGVVGAVDFSILDLASGLGLRVRPRRVRVLAVAVGVPVVLVLSVLVGLVLGALVRGGDQVAGVLWAFLALLAAYTWLVVREVGGERRLDLVRRPARAWFEAVGITATECWVAYRVLPLAAAALPPLVVLALVTSGSPELAPLLVWAVVCAVGTVAGGSLVGASMLVPGSRDRAVTLVGGVLVAAVALVPAAFVAARRAAGSATIAPPTLLEVGVGTGLLALVIGVLALTCPWNALGFDGPLRSARFEGGLRVGRLRGVTTAMSTDPLADPAFAGTRARFLRTSVLAAWVVVGALLAGEAVARLVEGRIPSERLLQATYSLVALSAFFAASETVNRIGVSARAARFRWAHESGVPAWSLVRSLVLVVAAVTLVSVAPVLVTFVAVVAALGQTWWSLATVAAAVVGLVVGIAGPLAAEGFVDSPMNPDGTKRVDFSESVVGVGLVMLPVLAGLVLPGAALPTAAVVLAVAVVAAAQQTRKGIVTCRAY